MSNLQAAIIGWAILAAGKADGHAFAAFACLVLGVTITEVVAARLARASGEGRKP